MNFFSQLVKVLTSAISLCLLLNNSFAYADLNERVYIPKSIEVSQQLTPVAGVTDLKFNEFYKMPVGPKGLEPTAKLISLVNKKVSIVGYVAHAEPAIPGLFILSPTPVDMGHDDEKLVDDFPPNVVFVHTNDKQLTLPHIDGLIRLTGVLQVGSFEEVDGHVSTFRLELDPAIEKDLKQALSHTRAAQK